MTLLSPKTTPKGVFVLGISGKRHKDLLGIYGPISKKKTFICLTYILVFSCVYLLTLNCDISLTLQTDVFWNLTRYLVRLHDSL